MLPEIRKKLSTDLQKRAFAVAELVRARVLEGMTGPRSGLVYRVPGTKRTYRASAPGEYPAIRLGALQQSIRAGVIVADPDHAQAVVGTPLPYGVHLEFGTRKMSPRPWLRPSFEVEAENIQKILTYRWLR